MAGFGHLKFLCSFKRIFANFSFKFLIFKKKYWGQPGGAPGPKSTGVGPTFAFGPPPRAGASRAGGPAGPPATPIGVGGAGTGRGTGSWGALGRPFGKRGPRGGGLCFMVYRAADPNGGSAPERAGGEGAGKGVPGDLD